MGKNTRKLAVALTSAGIATAAFGASTLPADADLRTFQVTLANGQRMTVTLDVPPGTPISQIQVPGATAPVVAITEIPPPPTPEPPPPVATQPPPQQQPPPQEPAPQQNPPGTSTGPAPSPADKGPQPQKPKQGSEPAAGGTGSRQTTTGTKPRRQVDARKEVDEVTGAVTKGTRGQRSAKDSAERRRATRLREPDGKPTLTNPTVSLATPGAAPLGVPNFFIDKFRIPPFLLSIYQAAGIEYGVRWEILAAINEIETDYGRNLNVSSAGAVGWMQFLPSTWKAYGVDANGDGRKDPYNPVDAIFAAGRYLKAAGAQEDLPRAIFAYNHADWYVDSVLMRARLIGGLPHDLVGSLTGLTQGMFPVYAKARYADDLSEREATRRIAKGRNAALPVESDGARRGIRIYAKAGSPVVAVQDGRIVRMGRSERLGRFIQLRDVYGNTYTYAHLASVADRHPVPRTRKVSRAQVRRELRLPTSDPKPTAPASAGEQRSKAPAPSTRTAPAKAPEQVPQVRKERLFALPRRPRSFKAGGREQLVEAGVLSGVGTLRKYFVGNFRLDRDEVTLKTLEVGSKVIGGTILGRMGRTRHGVAPHTLFEIRPAGRGAPRIDPKPILDGWKLLESTAIYRAKNKNPFFGPDARTPSIGQILLMGKVELERQVLSDPRIELYDCGRRDIRASNIDWRVLATLKFLSVSGLRPTVTSLQCGHSTYTSSGNISHHSTGTAVDIAKINGIPILGHQGEGSITDITVRRLLTLQGTMKPRQIITLMRYDGTDNTLAMSDHHDHIHIGWQPRYGANSKLGRQLNAVLKPGQWIKLIARLNEIDNPAVPVRPSKYAVTVAPRRASKAHRGE